MPDDILCSSKDITVVMSSGIVTVDEMEQFVSESKLFMHAIASI